MKGFVKPGNQGNKKANATQWILCYISGRAAERQYHSLPGAASLPERKKVEVRATA
jgi:hypothetical protein